MRLGLLAVAGLTAGVVAGFVGALLLPRRRTILDLTAAEAASADRDAPTHPVMANHVKHDSRTVAERP